MYSEDELVHHGIIGQKWGVRRFQNKDGTRTADGKRRAREGASAAKGGSNTKSKDSKNRSVDPAKKAEKKAEKAVYRSEKRAIVLGTVAAGIALSKLGKINGPGEGAVGKDKRRLMVGAIAAGLAIHKIGNADVKNDQSVRGYAKAGAQTIEKGFKAGLSEGLETGTKNVTSKLISGSMMLGARNLLDAYAGPDTRVQILGGKKPEVKNTEAKNPLQLETGKKPDDKSERKSKDKSDDKSERKSKDKSDDKSERKSKDKSDDKSERKSKDKSNDKSERKSKDKFDDKSDTQTEKDVYSRSTSSRETKSKHDVWVYEPELDIEWVVEKPGRSFVNSYTPSENNSSGSSSTKSPDIGRSESKSSKPELPKQWMKDTSVSSLSNDSTSKPFDNDAFDREALAAFEKRVKDMLA